MEKIKYEVSFDWEEYCSGNCRSYFRKPKRVIYNDLFDTKKEAEALVEHYREMNKTWEKGGIRTNFSINKVVLCED